MATRLIDLLEKQKTNKGYIFEVDLEYPSKLWKSHNDYPLAPEKMKINGLEKLIGSFKPRKHYVVPETHKGLKRVTLTCLFCPMLVIIHFRKYHIWNEKKR